MLVNVKKEDFYYSEDEIKQLGMEFCLNPVLEKMALNHYAFMLYTQNEHFYAGLSDRLVMSFIRHSKYKSIYMATQAYPNFCAYNSSSPYWLLYTKEAGDISTICYEEKVYPKWTIANTDPFLKQMFDNQEQILRKSEVIRVLGEFTRNVNKHLQKGKIAEIKEAAEQYSM
mgnify:CR=1 FL=1